MTTSTLSRLPAHLGYFLLSSITRLITWAFARFMAAPLQNTGIAVLSIALAFSASNALFWQTGMHPAPMFVTGQLPPAIPHTESSSVAPPRPLPAPIRVAPSSLPPVASPVLVPVSQPVQVEQSIVDHEVTNAALKAAQTILQSAGLYDGKIDGFYGPATAEGLRAFELRNGYTPRGALTPQIIARILASANARQPSAPSVIAQEPVSVQLERVEPVEEPIAMPEPTAAPDAVSEITDPLATITQSVARQTQTLQAEAPQTQPLPAPITSPSNSELIKKIQRGLASLAFLHGPIDGIAGETTARAIRNFEVYNNYEVTGRISPELLDLLISAGAAI